MVSAIKSEVYERIQDLREGGIVVRKKKESKLEKPEVK